MTKEFAAKILEVVPSERIKAVLDDPAVLDSYADDDQKLGRLLLTELLSWQFASPVRWIETQALLFGQREQGGLGVEEYVRSRPRQRPDPGQPRCARPCVCPSSPATIRSSYNVGRDEGRVYMTDTDSLVPDDEPEEAAASAPVETAPAGGSAVAELGSGAAPANAVTEAAQNGWLRRRTVHWTVRLLARPAIRAGRGRRTVRCRRRRPALQGFRCHRRAHGLLRQGAPRPDRQQRHH